LCTLHPRDQLRGTSTPLADRSMRERAKRPHTPSDRERSGGTLVGFDDEFGLLFRVCRNRSELAITFGGDLAQSSDNAAGSGGNQTADDDVFLPSGHGAGRAG